MGVNAVQNWRHRRRDAGFGRRYTERMTSLDLDRRAAIRDAELAEMRRRDGRLPPLGRIDRSSPPSPPRPCFLCACDFRGNGPLDEPNACLRARGGGRTDRGGASYTSFAAPAEGGGPSASTAGRKRALRGIAAAPRAIVRHLPCRSASRRPESDENQQVERLRTPQLLVGPKSRLDG